MPCQRPVHLDHVSPPRPVTNTAICRKIGRLQIHQPRASEGTGETCGGRRKLRCHGAGLSWSGSVSGALLPRFIHYLSSKFRPRVSSIPSGISETFYLFTVSGQSWRSRSATTPCVLPLTSLKCFGRHGDVVLIRRRVGSSVLSAAGWSLKGRRRGSPKAL